MLYVKKDKIKNLYPLLAGENPESEDIRKFEVLGTRSFAIEQAIGQAIDFHLSIGSALKQERLHYLKDYWTKAVSTNPRIKLWTDPHPDRSCALCVVSVEGKSPAELGEALHNAYKIHTTGIDYHNIHGVRVTPHVYTVKADLDRLIAALQELANT
jgi:selenocysteine lyase/cysteine desulfurase